MNSNNTVYVSDQLESGNIVHILAVFSDMDEDSIERQLRTGKNPWDLAKELGVLGRLRDELLGRVFSYLEVMVQEQQISQEDADEMIACFTRENWNRFLKGWKNRKPYPGCCCTVAALPAAAMCWNI